MGKPFGRSTTISCRSVATGASHQHAGGMYRDGALRDVSVHRGAARDRPGPDPGRARHHRHTGDSAPIAARGSRPGWRSEDAVSTLRAVGPVHVFGTGRADDWWLGRRGSTCRRDYRYEGLLIGGLPLGTLGFILGHGFTRDRPTVPGADCRSGGLGDGLTVGPVGAAVGGDWPT